VVLRDGRATKGDATMQRVRRRGRSGTSVHRLRSGRVLLARFASSQRYLRQVDR
jgi:hypothetical protein